MNAAGIAKLFELRGGDIDAVAMNFCYHVAQIDADAETIRCSDVNYCQHRQVS
jgi:hypothetical protein